MFPFSFQDHTKKEKKAIDQKNQEIKDTTETAAQTLRDCISSDTFIKYRKELETCDKALIMKGIEILQEIHDNDKRLALYDALFVRADVLSLLLKGIEKDRE